MKWIIEHGLLLCIGLIVLIGSFAVLSQGKIQISSSTWTVLLLVYFIILSLYSSYEHKQISAEKNEEIAPQDEYLKN